MMLVICNSMSCTTATRVYASSGAELMNLLGPKSGWWPNKFKCPTCEGEATAALEAQINPEQLKDWNIRELEAQDYFRFMMGVGLPEESDCTLPVLVEIFKAGKVAKLSGHPINGSKRYCLDWLEMEDGTRLYFGSSSHGAAIFRITKKVNYTEKALEDAG